MAPASESACAKKDGLTLLPSDVSDSNKVLCGFLCFVAGSVLGCTRRQAVSFCFGNALPAKLFRSLTPCGFSLSVNSQAAPGRGPVRVRGESSGSLPAEAAEKHRGQGQRPLRRRGRLWPAQGVRHHT